jgi:hypothetical protein
MESPTTDDCCCPPRFDAKEIRNVDIERYGGFRVVVWEKSNKAARDGQFHGGPAVCIRLRGDASREVGTQGIFGGQANVEGVQGTWANLTKNVNVRAFPHFLSFSSTDGVISLAENGLEPD